MPTLYVTLDTSGNSPVLAVNDSNGLNDIPRNSVAQTITWQLSGNMASGTFNGPASPNGPGFAWLGTQPPAGVFINPQLNGNQFSLSDLNNSPATTGTWKYQLCATLNGTTYKTPIVGLTGTTSTPKIKNN